MIWLDPLTLTLALAFVDSSNQISLNNLTGYIGSRVARANTQDIVLEEFPWIYFLPFFGENLASASIYELCYVRTINISWSIVSIKNHWLNHH